MTAPAPLLDVRAGRRRLLQDAVGITLSAVGFALVYGLAARSADFSIVEAMAMSLIVFAGASQFAAVGYLAAGMPWLPIVILTFLLNLRHALYSASLAPRVRDVPLATRAGMAHVLTDEAFALSAAHFQRIGRVDVPGYWIAAVLLIFIPWNLATIAGVLLGGVIPDPAALGLDVVFPAAMAGLAAGLVTGRRELVAAGAGAAIGVVASIAIGTEIGIVAGGLLGPLIAMAVPDGGRRVVGESEMTGQAVDLDEARDELAALGGEAGAGSRSGGSPGSDA